MKFIKQNAEDKIINLLWKKDYIHANPDKMPHRCPSKETFDMRSWNTINKINAYLKHIFQLRMLLLHLQVNAEK